MISVEDWCRNNKQKCFVFSTDKDILGYKSDELIIVPRYEDYLDHKLREIETLKKRKHRLDCALKLYEDNKPKLEEQVSKWLHNQLDNDMLFYKHFQLDVHSVDVKELYAELSEFQIISIDDYEINVEANADVFYRVEVEIDDENAAIYDSEDKTIYYYDNVTELVEAKDIVKVSMKITSAFVDDDFVEIEIDEINNGQELQIS